MNQPDIVIVGGGMTGAALANLLAPDGWRIAVIEHSLPAPYAEGQPLDLRVSAINPFSVEVLQQAGSWSLLQQMRLCPYRQLQTWESPGSELTFSAAQAGRNELGYIVENRLVQLALLEALAAHDNVRLISGCGLDRLEPFGGGWRLWLNNRERLEPGLVIGADGADSRVRQLAGIGITRWDYRQAAMVLNVTTEAPQQAITWQQFLPSGPRAFLPLPGHHASLVWYDAPERIEALMALSDEHLAGMVREAFPDRLGTFRIDGRGSFPLRRQHAHAYYRPQLALVGDAAHTINPLAGQGVNLGFRDVAELAMVLSAAASRDELLDPELLRRYQARRRWDNLLMQAAMDACYWSFGRPGRGARRLRSLGLKLAEHAGPLKRQALRYALGMGLPGESLAAKR